MSTSADRIAQLESEVADLRTILAAPKAAPSRGRRPRPRRILVVLGVALALILPAGVLAGGQTFADVPPSHKFFQAIEEVAAAGVTQGCGNGTNYCPNGLVTRGQMAAFMARLGALSSSRPPVVNAKTSQSTDGWSMGCPANTTYSQGKCFDNATRGNATSIYDASDKCATIGTAFALLGGHRWHLPGANELMSAARVTSLNLTNAVEWTSDMWIDSTDGWVGLQAYDAGIFGTLSTVAAGSTAAKYRCATYPFSWDGAIFVLGDAGLGSAPDSEAAAQAQVDQLGE